MPASVDQLQAEVEQVPRLGSLDQRPELLGHNLDRRQSRQLERIEAELGHIEVGVPNGEYEVLARADLDLCRSRIRARLEGEVNDRASRRPIGFLVLSNVEVGPDPAQVANNPLGVNALLRSTGGIDVRRDARASQLACHQHSALDRNVVDE
jgi:hypothetical protein